MNENEVEEETKFRVTLLDFLLANGIVKSSELKF